MCKIRMKKMQKNPLFLLMLIAFIVICFSNFTSNAATFIEDYDKAYDQYSALSKKSDRSQLTQTAMTFRELTKRKYTGKLKANPIYWEGQCLFLLGEYLHALQTFERVLVNHNSYKEVDARFKVVQCQIRLKWLKSTKWEFDRFVNDFPENKLIKVLKYELRQVEKNVR